MLALASGRAGAQSPVINSFTASPTAVFSGGNSVLSWTVTGATSLSIDQGVGTVTGSNVTVNPTATTSYTLTAKNASGSTQAATTVTVGPEHYEIAYDGVFEGTWGAAMWGPDNYNPTNDPDHNVNYAAPNPAGPGNVIEVTLGNPTGPWAFGLQDIIEPGYNVQWQYLNEMRTIDFDIYFEPDSTNEDTVFFILEDAGYSDEPPLVDLIPGWSSLPQSQRYSQWFHVTADLPGLNPTLFRFSRFLLYYNGGGQPHFLLSNVKLGWVDAITPSAVTSVSTSFSTTIDQLTLSFTTDEATIYRVEYGVTNFARAVQGDYDDWETNHAAVLAGLIPGVTNQYRILLLDHRTAPAATSLAGAYTNVFFVPATVTAPPATPAPPSPEHYIVIYDGKLEGTWGSTWWGPGAYSPNNDPTGSLNLSAAAPGLASDAIEVKLGEANGPWAAGLADILPGYDEQWLYLNEAQTVEFDIYFPPDAEGVEFLTFVYETGGLSDQPLLVDLIPGWFLMPHSQRYGQWHHVSVDLAAIHTTQPYFAVFLLWQNSADISHFFLSQVKVGWSDATDPVVTLVSSALSPRYDQLTLGFTTDQETIYSVTYSAGTYTNTIQGDPNDWSTDHTVTLTNLAPGELCQYRIVAREPSLDPAATPYQGVYAGAFSIPAIPVTPPLIHGLAATNITGSSATLAWGDDRACSAQVIYQAAGGPALTRTFSNLSTSHGALLDLLTPLTSYTVTVTVTDAFNLSSSQSVSFTTGTIGAPTITITADPSATHPISPWIYGINSYDGLAPADVPRHLTLNRAGGNRWTAYNWENNASNAGVDYLYESDDYLGGGGTPAEAVRSRVAADRARGSASLITLQLQGYVSADDAGPVDLNDPNHVANRFKQVVYRKNAPFTASPPTKDAYVYMDEFMWALKGLFPTNIFSDPATPTFISLDNEPDIWSSTHPEIQPEPMTVPDFIQKTIGLSTALKNVDPNVTIFGPVNYGFEGMVNWQQAPGQGFDDNYWFVDKYLQELKAASDTAGHRLLDVYDIHFYSSATDTNGNSVTALTSSNLTSAQIQAIVQSPRSLWDTNYVENSWIAGYLGGAPINMLGRLQTKIDADWAGTKLAITEYSNGGDQNIAGAIAEADNLGVFGSFGLFAATFWSLDSNLGANNSPFIEAAFKMYRDYDNNLGSFGDTSIAATSSDTSKVAAYVSKDSARPGRYVIVALNRSEDPQAVGFDGLAVSGIASVYRLQGTSTTPVSVGQVPVNLATWVITLPPLSVSTIEITNQSTTGTLPIVSTLSASGVTGISAIFNGTVDPEGLATVVSFAWGTNSSLGHTNAASGLSAGTNVDSVSKTLTGLTPATKYYYTVVASNLAGVVAGKIFSFTTSTLPVVTTLSATGITGISATLNGTVYPLGSVTAAGFVWGVGTNLGSTITAASLASAYGSQNVSNTLTGLTPGTTYYYAVTATNVGGAVRGAVRSFTTAPAPVVVTLPATGITGASATFNGTVYPLGSVTAARFVWGTSTNLGSTSAGGGLASAYGSQNVSNTLTGLTPGTTYYFAVVATNIGGTVRGAVRSFTTPSVPVVVTLSATGITGTSATLNGTVYPLGSVTMASFVWGVSTNLGGTNAVGSLASAYGSQKVSNTLTGLTPGKTYYFAVAAANIGGVVRGAVRTFTTPSAPVALTQPATDITGRSATLNGTVYPLGSVTTASFVWGVSTNLGSTNAVGSLASAYGSQKVSNTLSGLTPGTTYYFAVAATNIGGAARGAVRTFTTPSAPVAVTQPATDITGMSATLNGTVYPLGSVTTASFVWGVSTNLGSTNAVGSLASAYGSQNVSNTLSGLTPGTKYYYTVVASNIGGFAGGGIRSFSTTALSHDTERAGKVVGVMVAIVGVSDLADGTKRIELVAGPGQTYVIEAAGDPTAGVWTATSTNTAGSGGFISFIDLQTTNTARRFYRLRNL